MGDKLPLMPRTNQDGKDVKLVLSWLCKRVLVDAELARALDMPTSNYSRRKDAPDFPSFDELAAFADSFKLNRFALLISFSYLPRDAIGLLDESGMRQYVELGGGEVPSFSWRGTAARTQTAARIPSPVVGVRPPRTHKPRMRRRPDAPPGIS